MTTTTKKAPAKKAAAKRPATRAAAKKAPARSAVAKANEVAAAEIPQMVDALDRVQLYNLAKDERAAVKAWEKAGSKGELPATPALDRLNDPTQKAAKAKGERKSAKYDGLKDTLIERVKDARATGVSFPALAVVLNGEKFDGKSDWTGPKLYAFACRHDVGKLPLVKHDGITSRSKALGRPKGSK